MNRNDKIDRSELPPAEVGGPIDAMHGKGDQTAHRSLQSTKTRKEVDAQAEADASVNVEYRGTNPVANVKQAREEAGLGPDGNLKPDFDGTQPKVMPDGSLRVVGMEQLKEEVAAADGETVEEQEEAAGLDINDTDADEADEDEEEEEVEEEGNMTVAELKDALTEAGIEYSSSARKAELQELYAQIK